MPPPGGGFAPAAPTFATPAPSGSNGLAVGALVLGILSLLAAFFCGTGLLFGIIAIVLGVLGMKKANAQPGQPQRGLAIAGIVTGAIGVVISIIVILVVFVIGSTADDINSDLDSINSDPSNGVCDESRFLQDPDC